MCRPLITAVAEYVEVIKCTQLEGVVYVTLLPYQCRNILPNVIIHQLCITNRQGPNAYDSASVRKAHKSPTGLIHPAVVGKLWSSL